MGIQDSTVSILVAEPSLLVDNVQNDGPNLLGRWYSNTIVRAIVLLYRVLRESRKSARLA